MKRRIACMILAFAMAAVLPGCGKLADHDPIGPGTSGDAVKESRQDLPVTDGPAGTSDTGLQDPADGGRDLCVDDKQGPEAPPVTDVSDVNPVWFEDELYRYLDSEGWSGSSYMVSPASFRAALCLAIRGAEGDTKDGLLRAAGFRSQDDADAWYGRLLEAKADFEARKAAFAADPGMYEDGAGSGMAFDIANAIWDNSDFPGGFLDSYAAAVSDGYGAACGTSDSGHITDDVNRWCAENTGGMIKSISPDLSKCASVLANALYVKSSWVDDFYEGATEQGMFTDAAGAEHGMDFMHQTGSFQYYEDASGRRFASFPLEGDIYFTVCLGDALPQDFYPAMYNAEPVRLDVRMPKLDLETSFEKRELVGFLEHCGAGSALSMDADFSSMTDSPDGWYVDDVIQKTRLKTDEDGMEAAAVTAILMMDKAMFEPEPDPLPFHMDSPFSFMITKGLHKNGSGCMILFFGQFEGS